MTTITVPKEYGYVLFAAASSFLLAAWHGGHVQKYRTAAKIPYPNAYASQETIDAAEGARKKAIYSFNCAQRAHGNFQENYPQFLAGLLLSGLKYPVAATALGALWMTSRVVYARGYVDPEMENGRGRYKSRLALAHWLAMLGFIGLLGKSGFDLLRS